MGAKVGIAMPCINLWDKYTRAAILSTGIAMNKAANNHIECSFLLIDNGSTDETKEKASQMSMEYNDKDADPSKKIAFEYHRNEEMWGFQKSVNFGVNHFLNKGFDYVLVLNNDIVLHEDAIVELVNRFERGGVYMATCLDVTGECERDPNKLKDLKSLDKVPCPESPHPCFSAFMVSHECWEKVGEFDEIYFPAYYEDNDYHYRMQLEKLLAITWPPAMFFHWGSATQNEALGRPLTISSNQNAQYIRKWGGNPGKETYKFPYNDKHKTIKSTKQTMF